MAVGLIGLPALHPVPGVRLGTARAGIRKKDRRDLVVIECDAGTHVSAVFTRNRFAAAPVDVAKAHLAAAVPRVLLINTGFANAGTGERGVEDARRCCRALAELVGCAPESVLPFSTGVIGERLPADRVIAGLPSALAQLQEGGWSEAAHGIMTTDTVAKGSSRRLSIAGREVTVTGIAKGSGMIRPDMATMLAFVATDAKASTTLLAQILRRAVETSFNRITVDGDTSTNDACVLIATGRAGHAAISSPDDTGYAALAEAVASVCTELAQAIVRDGEGATKLITIEVTEGASETDCLAVAYAIAHSPLVKTAFFASDPNWGRILAAVGRAPVASLDVGRVRIAINGVPVVEHGAVAPGYTEATGAAAMRPAEIRVHVALGAGQRSGQVWTCDFSHDYVRINAEYRS